MYNALPNWICAVSGLYSMNIMYRSCFMYVEDKYCKIISFENTRIRSLISLSLFCTSPYRYIITLYLETLYFQVTYIKKGTYFFIKRLTKNTYLQNRWYFCIYLYRYSDPSNYSCNLISPPFIFSWKILYKYDTACILYAVSFFVHIRYSFKPATSLEFYLICKPIVFVCIALSIYQLAWDLEHLSHYFHATGTDSDNWDEVRILISSYTTAIRL